MNDMQTSPPLRETPLHAMHLRLGARMVPYAGYAMPIQYPSGIIREHLHTRAAAGLFDVSHMGQIALRPRSGDNLDAARSFETLVPADVIGLPPGRQRYTLLTTADGGVLDDLMVSNHGDHLRLVVNAARKAADEAYLRTALAGDCVVEMLTDRALLALQGPRAEDVLATLAPTVRTMRFMDIRPVSLLGETCLVSRSGYTGEDGFEIGTTAGTAVALWETLSRHPAVAPVGLGARDSLRLEAGLCLYGSDLDTTTTPVEAALEWTISAARRPGGARAGGFPGAAPIFRQLANGARRRRVGLRPEGRAPVRGGAPLFAGDGTPAGTVSSGGFGPSLDAPIAMGYVPTERADVGARLDAEVRGKRLAVLVSELPFIPPRYRRT
ncbi:MAG: glycine cleavage system aminomethyltransferase GcvT [Hyphomicrobiales bacterium]|nr:glycine cleavage system aminomethyltransferase GcvT [Hyphomicrobiales bacterium]